MTQPILPSGGGSYEREKDGTLTVLEQPDAAHDTAMDAPTHELVPVEAETPEPEIIIDVEPPKAPRRAAAEVKEA